MPSIYPGELMSTRAAAVQAGGWSQEQSGALTVAGKLRKCLLAGKAWVGLKNKAKSHCVTGPPFFLTGKHQHVATPFHRKSNWRVFCTQQTKHRTVLLMKLANIQQDCILFPRLKIPYTPWMHRDAGSKSLWYNAMMTLLHVWPLHYDGSFL